MPRPIERKRDHSDCQETTANRAAKTERPKTSVIVAPHSLARNIAKFISTSCITYYKILPYLRNNSKAEQIPLFPMADTQRSSKIPRKPRRLATVLLQRHIARKGTSQAKARRKPPKQAQHVDEGGLHSGTGNKLLGAIQNKRQRTILHTLPSETRKCISATLQDNQTRNSAPATHHNLLYFLGSNMQDRKYVSFTLNRDQRPIPSWQTTETPKSKWHESSISVKRHRT
jgi:hypothetical protein